MENGRVHTFWSVTFFQNGKVDTLNRTAQKGKGDALNGTEGI